MPPNTRFDRLQEALAANDVLARTGSLDEGRSIAAARTAAYDEAVAAWAARLGRESGHEGTWAVVALGGTGRREVCPCSDLDYAILLDGQIEAHPLLAEIQRQIWHDDQFEDEHGFEFEAYPFDLAGVTAFDDPRQLNSFLDMRPVHDPGGLAPRFRARIAETFDPFAHFLHLRSFWTAHWGQAAEQAERLDRFDIKNDGLRLFLAAVWLLGGKDFRHSQEIYATLDERVLEAYGLLLRVRQFIHHQHRASGLRPAPLPDGRHAEDVLEFGDFVDFGGMLPEEADVGRRFEFSNEVRARLLAARRQVAVFAKGVIGRELRVGRPVASGGAQAFGSGGLRAAPPPPEATGRERSRAALSLLGAAQRYDLPIDDCELEGVFQHAGEWLEPVPELGNLLYERGSLAASFLFLSQIPGAEERLFPGYGRFEASLDERVMLEKKSLRGTHANAKIRALEGWVAQGRLSLEKSVSGARLKNMESEGVLAHIEAAQLDADQLAAIKLALKTKRLPLTPEDAEARRQDDRPLQDRFASGLSDIPLDRYFQPYREPCGLSAPMLDLTEFLIRERRLLKSLAEAGLAERSLVHTLAERCRDEGRLRALFVFTCADRVEWESEQTDPARWFCIRELYYKAMQELRGPSAAGRSLLDAGFSEDDLEVLRGFGSGLVDGSYWRHALRLTSRLLRLAADPGYDAPKAMVIRDGGSEILGVASRDFRGLAAIITGTLVAEGFAVVQAHLFSSTKHSLALDFFHLGGPAGTRSLAELPGRIEADIRQRIFRPVEETVALAAVGGEDERTLTEWRPGLFCLAFATRAVRPPGAILHTLVHTVFQDLRGNVHALKARSARGWTFVSVYHTLPPDLGLDEARRIIAAM